jgi:hypothetical protein
MSQCDPSKICSVCDQNGLALMPLRYAVAQPAPLGAPAIQAPFGEGLEHVALPEHNASYTLRQLRGGYLYVFNEVRSDWKAYVVTVDAYLLEYDIHDQTPPNVEGARPCSRMALSASSRCVMIPDADRSGRIWLGFSDVAWTAKVLEQNRQQAYREQHMRCIDIGAWAKGNGQATQPHLQALSKAPEHVAEYSVPADPATQHGGISLLDYRAYSHSPQNFNNSQSELDAFLQSAKKSGKGLAPAMVALQDPVGVTLEINSLILGEVEKFEADEDRNWKQTTSVAIAGLRQMMEDDAVAKALFAHQNERYATLDGVPLYPEWDEEMRERNEVMFASLPAAQEQKVRTDAWARYADNYSETGRLAFEQQLDADLARFMQDTVTPLVKSFIGWYWSDRFRQAMVCNHDPQEWDSGQCYTAIVGACLSGLTGHQLIIEQLLQDLRGHYNDLNNITLRALVLNNAQAARQLEESATAELAVGNPFAWRNVLNAFDHVRGKYGEGQLKHGLARAAGLAHQISGAMVSSLGNPVKSAGAKALDLSIRYRLMGLLGALSGKQILSLSTQASEAQMAHIISEKVALLQPDVDRGKLRKRIAKELERLGKEPGVRASTAERNARRKKTFTWSLMLDQSAINNLQLDEHGRIKGDASLLVTHDKLRRVISDQTTQWPKIAHLDIGMGVVGSILDGWNAVMAAQQVDEQGWTAKSGVNMVAAVSSLAGAGADIVHRVWSKYPVEQMRLGRSIRIILENHGVTLKKLAFIGKLLGAIGGMLTAVVDFISALEAQDEGDLPVFILRLSVALLGGAITLAMFWGFVSAGVGLIVFLVLAALSMFGEWVINLLRDNKIEVWLSRTPFGTEQLDRFMSLPTQNEAWEKLLGKKIGIVQ